MAYLLSFAYKSLSYAMNELADKRVSNWFLMDSVAQVILIDAAYVYGVKVLGPKLMENRKSFNIDKLLIAYNFIQMLINAYIIYSIGGIALGTFNCYCVPFDYSNNPNAVTLLNGVYLYFLIKLLDLLDTVFFVLRKKQKQITFLHVYHHSVMFFGTWIGAKFFGGGYVAVGVTVNSFVHVCMYCYYLLSVINKDLRNNVSVKKRITELQLAQFVIGLILAVTPMLNKDCVFPRFLAITMMVQGIFGLCLFGDFYIKSYVLKKKPNQVRSFGCLTVTNQDSKLSDTFDNDKKL